jgi:hypothetical protein
MVKNTLFNWLRALSARTEIIQTKIATKKQGWTTQPPPLQPPANPAIHISKRTNEQITDDDLSQRGRTILPRNIRRRAILHADNVGASGSGRTIDPWYWDGRPVAELDGGVSHMYMRWRRWIGLCFER